MLGTIKGLIWGKSVNKSGEIKRKSGNLLVAAFPGNKDPNHQREILRREAELTSKLDIS